MIVVVHGPMACGKTRNALLLKSIFGSKRVVDSWAPRRRGGAESHVPLRDGDLILTYCTPPEIRSDPELRGFTLEIHAFKDVKRANAGRRFLPGKS